MFRETGHGDAEQDMRTGSGFDDILITRRLTDEYLRSQGLVKFWLPKYLWSLGLGTVISGTFFFWGLALDSATPLEFLAAFCLISIIAFVFFSVVAELGVHFPYAGGPYAYGRRGVGIWGGYGAGVLLSLSLLSAASALLMVIKNYLEAVYPGAPGTGISFLIFGLVLVTQAAGLGASALLQFFFTCCALSGIILFILGTGPGISGTQFFDSLRGSFSGWGIAHAIPIVLFFYLGMAGLTAAAEETKNAGKSIPAGVFLSFASAFLIPAAVFFFLFGSVSAAALSPGAYPLLSVLRLVQPGDPVLLSTFAAVSLSAFVSGLNGLVSGYSRQIFALARAGYFPRRFSRLGQKRRTPYLAIFLPGLLPMIFCLSGRLMTAVITSGLSALVLQFLVLVSFIRIYRTEPELFHFSGRLYRFGLVFAALLSLGGVILSVAFFYPQEAGQVLFLWLVLGAWFFFRRSLIQDDAPEESRAVSLEKRLKIHFH